MIDGPASQRGRAWARRGAVAALLAGYFALALGGVWNKSNTFDEIAHLTAGYSYWLRNDYRLHPENGNWPQRWAALPLMGGQPAFPERDFGSWQVADVWGVGEYFFYRLGNDIDSMLRLARATIVLLGAALGWLVYAWSRRLFGTSGGLVSLLAYACCPTMLAHGALVTSDMAAALAFAAATGGLWYVMHRVSWRSVTATALVTGGLFLAKFSAVILLPVAGVLLAARLAGARPLLVYGRGNLWLVRGRGMQLAALCGVAVVHAAATWLMIWASYGFRYEGLQRATEEERYQESWEHLLEMPGAVTSAIEVAREHHLLPEAYLYGFAHTVRRSQARNAFFNGEFSTQGWYTFFPYCLLVKTPLPLFVLLGLAAGAVAWRWRRLHAGWGRSWRSLVLRGLYDTAPLWALLAVYWAFAVTSKLNIGHRHIMPTYPSMFILAGAAGYWFSPGRPPAGGRRRWRQRRGQAVEGAQGGWSGAVAGATVVVLAWSAFEAVSTWPHYLAYFNQLVGGPANGYKHLVDSSLDWGQELPALKRWLDTAGLQGENHPPVYLSYFGTASPDYYGIDARLLPCFFDRTGARLPEPLDGGVYCISATMLAAVYVDTPGPWSDEHEKAYRGCLHNLKLFGSTDNNAEARTALLAQTGEEFWWRLFRFYEHLRLTRLCHVLRLRRPDHQVGYAILVYRLSDEEVRAALEDPVAGQVASGSPAEGQ